MEKSNIHPINRVFDHLGNEGFDLSKVVALEAFARTGDWHTRAYASHVQMLEAWEISPNFAEEFRRNFPSATVRCVDSIERVRSNEGEPRFDLIVLDNPQGCYGPNDCYAEHFDIIAPSLDMLRTPGVMLFNVNIKPYNYDAAFEWKRRRADFYALDTASDLDLGFVNRYYRAFFESKGFSCQSFILEPRNEFIYYAAALLNRRR